MSTVAAVVRSHPRHLAIVVSPRGHNPLFICSEEDLGDDISEDLEMVMQRLLQSANNPASASEVPHPTTERHPEVIDDFIRNFLIKLGMMKTLDTFESEWCGIPGSHYTT
jgi:hypothetical protein